MNTVLGSQDRAPWRWVTLPSGPVVITDASLGFHFRVPVTEAAVLEPPLNGSSGQPVRIRFDQDATGHAVTLHSTILGSATISAAANAVTIVELLYDEITATWRIRPIGLTQAEADVLYQPLDADLTAIAALTTDAFGRTLLTLTTELAVRTYIGATSAGSAMFTAVNAAAQKSLVAMTVRYQSGTGAVVAFESVIVDSSGGAATATLPAAPVANDVIEIKRSGANTVTIARNGKKIENAAANLDITTDLVAVTLKYDDSNGTWWAF